MKKLAYTTKKCKVIDMEIFNQLYGNILSKHVPEAVAWVQGNEKNKRLSGIVSFYSTMRKGILISAEMFGLPDEENKTGFYGMHIHEYGNCKKDFSQTGNHYNPDKTMHPMHAGDLPPLLSNHGYAWMAFYDDRLSIREVIGRSIVIHRQRDNFSAQPSGDSGDKIACGVITPTRR